MQQVSLLVLLMQAQLVLFCCRTICAVSLSLLFVADNSQTWWVWNVKIHFSLITKNKNKTDNKNIYRFILFPIFYSLFILLLLICGIIRATSASSLASESALASSASSILSLVSLRYFHLIRFSNFIFILVYLSIYLYFIGDFFRSFVARVVVRLFCMCPTDRSKEIVYNLIYVQFWIHTSRISAYPLKLFGCEYVHRNKNWAKFKFIDFWV